MSANHELEAAAEEMIVAAEHGRSATAVMRRRCPYIYRQIRRDAPYPAMLQLWGRSVNFDEFARQTIVHPALLRSIGELAGVRMAGRVVHAGLQHTYGYLFSLIETPYGFKRERWTSTDLERGFGIEESLLGERPVAGTLLANLTWFLGKIAFRAEPNNLARLRSFASAVAPELVGYDFSRLQVRRVIESFVAGAGQRVSLFTDLLDFPRPDRKAKASNTLLVYSIQASPRSRHRLITAFTIADSVKGQILDSAHDKKPVPIQLRYNAYLRGCNGRTFRGTRRLVDQN